MAALARTAHCDEAPRQPGRGTEPHSPLGVEDAEERGPTPVLARQGEDSPQVVEGDVALGEAALQPRFLEGGPLFLQSPGAAQVSLREDEGRLNTSLGQRNRRSFNTWR